MEKFTTAIVAILVSVAGVLAIGMLMSLPVYFLWNYALVGAVTGIQTITWLQAFGIFVLCNFLFKSTLNSK